MNLPAGELNPAALLARRFANWLLGWWRIVHIGAVVGVMALSRHSYGRAQRREIARHMVLDTAPVLAANDAVARVAVSLEDGRVAQVGGAPRDATLEITGGIDTLCDVLTLRRDPNEPYLFGELSVMGAEADFVRLDYIVSRLCPQ